ncbi:MAG: efflux RND transporter periplasmic adaptor subunit [Planctomycetota bacterium]
MVSESFESQASSATLGQSTRDSSNLSDRVRSLRLPAQTAPASNWRAKLPWALCALFAITTAGLVVRSFSAPLASEQAAKSSAVGVVSSTVSAATPKSPVTPGKVAVASSGDVALESKGYIIPAHQILVSPKVSGMVVKLNIEEGQRVKKGDVLAELESIEYQAEYDRSLATLAAAKQRLLELERGFRPEEIEQAHAELEESEAQRVQLLADHQRNEKLRLTNAVAAREFQLSEAAYKAMDRRVERLKNAYRLMVEGPRKEKIELARAEVQQSEADVVKAQWRLDNCTIKAPVSGTILKKNAEEGNIVNPIAFNGSYSLCDLADLADLEVELSIQERDVARVFKGQRCKVRPDAFPDRIYDGVVSRLMPIADRAKGAIPVRVKLAVPADEEGVYLKPEMGAVVSFLNGPDSTAKKD